MKKNDARDNYTLTKHKVIRIMKLSTLFIFCLVFSLSATVYAQKKKISINERNTTILNVLKTIENNSEFVFFFNDNQIDVTQQIDINVKDATLAEILNQLLTPANYNYKIIDRQVLITKAKTKEAGLIAQQNQKKITGTIVDSKGIPIIGANVVEEGTTNGTITDLDGKFILTLKKGANLLISYIGYSEQKIATAGKSSLQIILKEDSELLDEVVVVGYGTLDKKEVTSSISSIKNKDFISGELASPLQAIKGKVSNLSVINTNGADPNSGVSLQLRGANSINAGQGPLVVVDGIAGGNIND
ncbi:MAG: carboxypeptidase-like regulatory domain-containing protein, partial [Massilibacteroides sp.]|nr:carboxypeptidase-like regulatory domain-containing protein [Massilibacteroides sp.]